MNWFKHLTHTFISPTFTPNDTLGNPTECMKKTQNGPYTVVMETHQCVSESQDIKNHCHIRPCYINLHEIAKNVQTQ